MSKYHQQAKVTKTLTEKEGIEPSKSNAPVTTRLQSRRETRSKFKNKYSNRIVKVKILNGRNKGKILEGTVKENTNKNRDKYPYRIIYKKIDKEADDFVDDIENDNDIIITSRVV